MIFVRYMYTHLQDTMATFCIALVQCLLGILQSSGRPARPCRNAPMEGYTSLRSWARDPDWADKSWSP